MTTSTRRPESTPSLTARAGIAGRGALVLTVVLALGALGAAGSVAASSAAGPAPDDLQCFGATATIIGTPGDDVIHGTNGPDVIVSGRGDDLIDGRGGDDLICGRSGNDTIRGGGGDDRVKGWRGEDRITGGPGDDRLYGGPHADKLLGGSGDDVLDGGPASDECDGQSGTNTLLNCEVTPNVAPTAVDDAATTDEDSSKAIAVLANDTDPDGDPLSVTALATAGTKGTVTITGGGAGVSYDPHGQFDALKPGTTGTDSFTYTVSDGQGGTDVATVTVTVTGVEDAPVAVADSRTVGEDSSPTTIDVLANDTDADGGTPTITSVTQPGHGAVVITNGGADLTYAPAADYCNAPPPFDDFTYTLNGGSTATVHVTVTCVDDAPVVDLNGAGGGGANATAGFTEDSGPVAVGPAAELSDIDSANLVSATLTLTNHPDGAAESLSVVTSGTSITASAYDSSTGVLTLSGSDTVAHYQQVVRSLSYDNSSDTPDLTDRVVDVKVNDGSLDSNQPHSTVSVSAHNDAPHATDQSGLSTAEDTALPVTLAGTDPEGDTLTFSHDPASAQGGTVTGSGTSVTYTPAADYCGPDSFGFGVDDGNGGTDTGTVSITVTCVDDAPVVDLNGAGAGNDNSVSFAEQVSHTGGDVLLAPNGTLVDIDDSDLVSLTVTLTNPQDGTSELLTADTSGTSITADAYDAGTGVLLLHGTDTKAHYQQVLRTVSYRDDAAPPDATDRAITFVANDGDLDSVSRTTTVTVVPLDAPPVVDLNGAAALGLDATASFTEDAGAATLAPDADLADADTANLVSATVTLTDRPDDVAEILTANVAGTSVTADAYDPVTGVLLLHGSDTVAHYQQVIRTLAYNNNADVPDVADRTVTVVANDGLVDSNTATVTVSVTAADDPPTLDLNGAAGGVNETASYTEDQPATTLAPNAVAADLDNTTLQSATITLTNHPDAAAEALAVDTVGTSITAAAYDSGTGVLTLSGSDTVANYQKVIRSATYVNTSQNPTAADRIVTFVVNDGTAGSNSPQVTVTITVVNDAPTLTQPDSTMTYTEDVPTENHADPVAPNLTASDVDNADLASATVQITSNYQSAEDVLAFTDNAQVSGSFDSGTGTLTLTPTGATATVADFQAALRAVTYANTSDTPDTSTRTVSLQVDDGQATSHASNTVTRDIDVIATNDAPVADDESLTVAAGNSAVGNTTLGVGTSPAQPSKSIAKAGATDVLVGDADVDGPGPLVVMSAGSNPAADDGLTQDGGTVTIAPNGDFTYTPAANAPSCADTSDSFDYVVSDQNPGTAGTDIGTVTIEVANCVWYVDSSVVGPGTGTSADPFKALSGVNVTASDADGAGDTIMILNNTSYAGGLPLENNELLRSRSAGLVVGSSTIVTATGTNPTITNAGGNALTLGSGNTVQGIDLGTTPAGSTALFGSGVGTATVNTVTPGSINNTSGGAVDISNGTVAMTFTSITSHNASNDGIRLDNVAGTFTGSGGSLQDAGAGQDVDISGNNSGDTVVFTYGGTITDDVGQLVNVSGQSGGTKDFNGAITDGNDGDGSGISLTNNTGATIQFSAGLTLSTGTNAAFTATGGGTVGVSDPGGVGVGVDNTIATTTGTALNVTNTTIDNSDLTFRSIASNGAASGIVLNNTSNANGRLVVAGNGGTCTGAGNCSGGAIQGSTGPGILLTSVPGGASFTRIAVTNSNAGDDGIRATTVDDIDLADSVILNNGNSHAGGAEERGLDYLNVTGTPQILRTTVSGSDDSNANIRNTVAGTTTLTVDQSTFSDSKFNTGLRLRGEGQSTMSATVTNSTFSTNADVGFSMQTDSANTATQTLLFDGNNVSGGSANAVSGRPEISINADSASTVKATISNNNVKSAAGAEIILNTLANHTGTFDAKVIGNDIGDAQPGALDSLADGGSSIWGWAHGDGVTRMEIRNNTVQNWGGRAMELSHNDGTGAADFTVTGNTFSNPDATANTFEGVYIFAGGAGGDTSDVCVDLENNDIDGIGRQGVSDIALDRFAGTFLRFADFNDTLVANLQNNLRGKNPASPNLTVETFSNGPTATPATSCNLTVGTP